MPTIIPAQETAIFNEQVLATFCGFKQYGQAREYLLGIINDNTKARPENLEKARNLVLAARSLPKLTQDVYNFYLAHQGLKVVK